MPIVVVQQYLLSLLDGLELPYGVPAAKAFITPPDPRVQAKVPAIYIWPSDGIENRSTELGGTIPRNTGPNTPSGTKGLQHQMDVYVTWFSSNSGTQADPKFPAIVDTVMMALRYSQPNPYEATDPATNLTSSIYNTGEQIRYRTGVEATADERWLRYDALLQVTVWELINA
jgi:hypothetical protein